MQDITDLDQLDNYFTQVSLEEQTIQLALQDILFAKRIMTCVTKAIDNFYPCFAFIYSQRMI